MKIDNRSEHNIATLHPELQPLARKLIEQAQAQGINAKVISGYRSYEEQNALYAQGRTKPGKIVTKAKGGQSIHNLKCAFDIGIFSKDGKTYYGDSHSYATCGKIGKELGLSWGGDWVNFSDEPHFELTKGRSLAELREAFERTGDALA